MNVAPGANSQGPPLACVLKSQASWLTCSPALVVVNTGNGTGGVPSGTCVLMILNGWPLSPTNEGSNAMPGGSTSSTLRSWTLLVPVLVTLRLNRVVCPGAISLSGVLSTAICGVPSTRSRVALSGSIARPSGSSLVVKDPSTVSCMWSGTVADGSLRKNWRGLTRKRTCPAQLVGVVQGRMT